MDDKDRRIEDLQNRVYEKQQEIERLKRDKWISVDDRLPEIVVKNNYCDDNVLVCSEKGSIDVIGVVELRKTSLDKSSIYYKVFTHWQPLPVGPEV